MRPSTSDRGPGRASTRCRPMPRPAEQKSDGCSKTRRRRGAAWAEPSAIVEPRSAANASPLPPIPRRAIAARMRARRARPLPTIVDRLSPEAVLSWVPDTLAGDALFDVARGRVARPRIGTNAVEAIVADERRGQVSVRIAWGAAGPVSSCECGAPSGGPCRHAAALGYLFVGAAAPGGA